MHDLAMDEIEELKKTIADLEEAQKRYSTALMVYDVTVACLEPFLDDNGMMGGQIKAARTAFTEATGEVPFKLRKFKG